jgi:phage/plasmid-associated DNA primase
MSIIDDKKFLRGDPAVPATPAAGIADSAKPAEPVASTAQQTLPIEIPQELIDAGARFILVKAQDKAAFEPDWQTSANYSADSQRLQDHLALGGNYGVLSHGDICMMDVDKPQELKNLDPNIPFTFVVVRGESGRGHVFFKCPDCPPDKRGKFETSFGDVRTGGNFYVVGAGSTHPSGDKYNVHRKAPLTDVPWAEIERLIAAKPRGRVETTGNFNLPDEIREGEPGRNKTLYSYGCSLRALGRDDGEISLLIHDANSKRCRPAALPEDEISMLIRSVLQHKKGVVVIPEREFPRAPRPAAGIANVANPKKIAEKAMQDIYSAANAIRASMEVYKGNARIEKMKAIQNAIYLRERGFSRGRDFILATINKRCDPSLTEDEIIAARNDAIAIIDPIVEMFNKSEADEKVKKAIPDPDLPKYIVTWTNETSGVTITRLDDELYTNFLKDHFSIVYFNKTLFIYDAEKHLYRENTNEIQTHVRDTFNEYNLTERLTQVTQEVMAHLKAMGGYVDYPFGTSIGYLNLANGVFDAKTKTLIPYTTDILFDYAIATPYRGFTETKELDIFFEQYGNTEAIAVLAKALWQRCWCDTIKEMTVFFGDKDTGKTTMAELVQATLDGDVKCQTNTARTLLGSLLQRFGYQGQEHKLLNIGDDLPDMFVKNASKINDLLGSVRHEVEHKGVDPYPTILTSYFLFTTNNLPPLDDDDMVLWSKIRLVRFDCKEFARCTVVRETLFTDVIKQQLLYKAVQLMLSWQEHPYKNDQSPEEVRRIWHEASTDVDAYFVERLVSDYTAFTTLHTITADYESWCKENERHRHIKYLNKKLQPYLARRVSGNGYLVRFNTDDEKSSQTHLPKH